MYIPEQFREDQTAVLHDFIDQHSFGTLVTSSSGQMIASHLPFVLDQATGTLGTLRAHLARANPQLEHLRAGADAMVLFQGAHAYISPAWYEDTLSVPTWNYTAVHVYGVPVLLEGVPVLLEDQGALSVLRALFEKHDPAMVSAWESPEGQARTRAMLHHITAFEIRIRDLQGKFKLSQNRSAKDREGVIRALRASADPHAREVAELMKDRER